MIVTVATTNAGKLRELAALLGPRLELTAAPAEHDAPEENRDSYVENARTKARALSARGGGAALADDSGLEVDALDGRPGVRSARYGGSAAERNRQLLEELRGRAGAARRAQFRTALVLVLDDGREFVAEGTCAGEIAEQPRGVGGFGYDPIFLVPALDKTFAELSSEEKNQKSARAAAARALLAELDRAGL